MDNKILPKESIIEKIREKYPDLEIGFGEDSVEFPKNINKCVSTLRAINPDADFYPAIILKNRRFLYAIIRHSTDSDVGINIPSFVIENTYCVSENESNMHMIEDGYGNSKTITFFKLLDI